MNQMAGIVTGLVIAVVAFGGAGCKKKTSTPLDSAFHHTPENTYQQIQKLRLQLVEAMEKKELQYIHDSMYYFEDLLKALSAGLEGERKQQVDAVLVELQHLAAAIDNSAGRGNEAATEANLQKLIETLKELERHFQMSKK